MAENRIEIMFEMIDKASPEFKRINQEAINQVKNLERETSNSFRKVNESANKSTSELKKFGDKIKDIRNQLFVLGVVLAIAVKGLNDAAKYNAEAKRTSDAFNKSLTGLSATLGQTFEPAIKGLTVAINAFRLVIESALGGFIKLFSFTFEFLSQLPQAFANIFANIKSIFTGGDDPIGIIEGFQKSFDRALEVANIATDQILQKFEETRGNIETGNTLEAQKEQIENLIKISEKSGQAYEDAEEKKRQAQQETQSFVSAGLATIGYKMKAAAVIVKAIKMKENIMETASGISKALGSYPPPINFFWAALVGAAGAAQAAAIASVGFAKGTDSVPSMLTPGEMVVPRDFATAVRSGDITIGGRGGGSGSFGDINIFIQGGINNEGLSVVNMAEKLGFEFERQLRTARGF